jgi:ribosomal protein S27AE
MPQRYYCTHCGHERVLDEDPVMGPQTTRAGCRGFACETMRTFRAVGRAAGSLRALDSTPTPADQPLSESKSKSERGHEREHDHGREYESQGAQDTGLTAHEKTIAEIRGSGAERVREIIDLETMREEPRREIVAAANQRLAEIREYDPDDGGGESSPSPSPSSSPPLPPASSSPPSPSADETRSTCPGCGEPVVVKQVFERSACPECEMALATMFETDRDQDRNQDQAVGSQNG